MHELMFQAGVKGMSERSELLQGMSSLRYYYNNYTLSFNIHNSYQIINSTCTCTYD